MSAGSYTPTSDDITNVIKLLHENGIDVSNSKAAYQSLKAYEGNPQFCVLLAAVYGAEECPVQGLNLPVPWPQYRQLAAITLKNNVSVAKQALGEEAVSQVAQCALSTLCNPPDARIARASAQIVVKVTEITSFEWWATRGLGDLADTLLNKLLSGGGVKTLAALYTLQYLMEDMPKQVGQSSENIVTRVAQLAVSPQVPLDLRKASFRMCFNIFERSSLLDWNVDVLAPLQQGLVNASWTFAQTCTALLETSCENDAALMTTVLRSCLFLLEYFDYFYNMTPADQQRMAQFWVVNTMTIITQNAGVSGNGELLGAAIELICGILAAHDATSGDGTGAFLAGPAEANIPTLIPALVKCCFMSTEEVESITASDGYDVHEQAPVRFENEKDNKDISQDETLDDEEAAMTLRRSALRCIDQLCSFASGTAYNILTQQMQPLWGSEDWRAREAGMVLVGTMATGCATYMTGILPTLVEQLVGFAGNTNEHVCVSSIAIWSLSRLAEAMLTFTPQYFDKYFSTIIARMPSKSKRVQHSSVSAVDGTLRIMSNQGCENLLMSHFQALLNTIAMSLPLYASQSLAVLINLVGQVLNSLKSLGADDMITQMGGILKNERVSKAQVFAQSYTATFISETPNSFVDTDVFSLDRGIITVLSLQPDNGLAASNLSVWNGVLQDILSRNLLEEANLVLGVISICFGYFCSISSDAQQQWNQSTSGSLPQSIMQVLSKAKSTHVRSAAITMLETLARMLGAAAVSDATYDPIMKFIAAQITDEDDARLKHDLIQLAVTLITQNPGQLSSPTTAAVVSAISAALRSDVYGDSLYFYTGMAFEACRLLAAAPRLVGSFNLDIITALLARADNDMDKSEATIRWSGALSTAPASVLDQLVSRIIVVTFSWQQVAHQFPGTPQAIASVLHRISNECGGTFQHQLHSFPAPAQQMLLSLYFQ